MYLTRTPNGLGHQLLASSKGKEKQSKEKEEKAQTAGMEGCTYVEPDHPEWVMAPAACFVKGNKSKEKERNAQTALCAPEEEHPPRKVRGSTPIGGPALLPPLPLMGYGTSCLHRKKEKKSKARRRKKSHKPQAWRGGGVVAYIQPEHSEWVMEPAACFVKRKRKAKQGEGRKGINRRHGGV